MWDKIRIKKRSLKFYQKSQYERFEILLKDVNFFLRWLYLTSSETLTITTKCSILDVTAASDPPLILSKAQSQNVLQYTGNLDQIYSEPCQTSHMFEMFWVRLCQCVMIKGSYWHLSV